MRILGAGAASRDNRGVTLLELLIVMTIVALLAGLSYPSVSAGIDSMRLRSAGDEVASFLNVAMDRADRKQQVVEIRISPAENAIGARSADSSFDRKIAIPDSVRIATVGPVLANTNQEDLARRFLLYPGGTLPRIAIGLVSKDGRKRQVIVDPMTGMPRSEAQ
jgi:general secretion pathway protein H